MARTKASVGSRFASGKSSKARCSAAPPPSSSISAGTSDKSSRSSSGGGNPVCPRETPAWQKPITTFFMGAPSNSSDVEKLAGPSNRSSKPNTDESPRQELETTQDNDDNPQKHDVSDENDDSNNLERRKPRKKIILSDDEDTSEELDQSQHRDSQSQDRDPENKITTVQSDEDIDKPRNQVLDETIILEPLNGEDSHKINEYYRYKNKGEGKKSNANKENVDVKSNNSFKKRCLDESDDAERVSKKVKVAPIDH